MKKLMFAATLAAVSGGAFAAPLMYDYKASVKHMYLKEVNVSFNGGKVPIYQKVQKSASLKGYLIVDTDGATSGSAAGIQANVGGAPLWATGAAINAGQTLDHGRNRAFLVVQNKSATTNVRKAKVLPAILDAKWMDTKFKTIGGVRDPKSDLAEGYLYVGGDAVAPIRPKLDVLDGTVTSRGIGVDPSIVPAAATAGMTMIADYAWTSVYLFGVFNGPNWFFRNGASYAQNAETAIDAVQPAAFQIQTVEGSATWFGSHPFYHDTWMNGAGIGKYTVSDEDICCGIEEGGAGILASLSGNLKGGLFLCTENGIRQKDGGYNTLNFVDYWEDQFFTSRLTPGVDWADIFQLDLWQDGDRELNTTDVIFGSWSIKRNRNFLNPNNSKAVRMNATEIARLTSAAGATPAALFTENALGLDELTAAIKGAIVELDHLTPNTAVVVGNRENWRMTTGTRFEVAPITPQFGYYYGLADWQ